jgi:hypothetical protein
MRADILRHNLSELGSDFVALYMDPPLVTAQTGDDDGITIEQLVNDTNTV